MRLDHHPPSRWTRYWYNYLSTHWCPHFAWVDGRPVTINPYLDPEAPNDD